MHYILNYISLSSIKNFIYTISKQSRWNGVIGFIFEHALNFKFKVIFLEKITFFGRYIQVNEIHIHIYISFIVIQS